jgi:hypothetical protein
VTKEIEMTRKSKKTTSPDIHDPEILRGMVRGPWADLWACEQEEQGASFSGKDIYEVAPEPPRWAKQWGANLATKILLVNIDRPSRVSSKPGLLGLYEDAVSDGFAKNKETFGYYLGMQACGHGVSWTDDHSSSMKITIPYDPISDHGMP